MLLSKPKLVLMDESTSALDTANERLLYQTLRAAGITFVSVGHRCASLVSVSAAVQCVNWSRRANIIAECDQECFGKTMLQQSHGVRCLAPSPAVPSPHGSSPANWLTCRRRPTLVEYHEQVLRLYPAQSGSQERPTWEVKPTAALDPAEIA